jgi:hypothetical protein
VRVHLSGKFFETNPVMPFQSGFSSVEQTPDDFFFYGMGSIPVWRPGANLKTDVNFNMPWSRVFMDKCDYGYTFRRLTSDGGYVFTGKRKFSTYCLKQII